MLTILTNAFHSYGGTNHIIYRGNIFKLSTSCNTLNNAERFRLRKRTCWFLRTVSRTRVDAVRCRHFTKVQRQWFKINRKPLSLWVCGISKHTDRQWSTIKTNWLPLAITLIFPQLSSSTIIRAYVIHYPCTYMHAKMTYYRVPDRVIPCLRQSLSHHRFRRRRNPDSRLGNGQLFTSASVVPNGWRARLRRQVHERRRCQRLKSIARRPDDRLNDRWPPLNRPRTLETSANNVYPVHLKCIYILWQSKAYFSLKQLRVSSFKFSIKFLDSGTQN